MRIKTRIKMGFKLVVISILVLLTITSTMSNRQLIKTEVFDFNKTLGMNASATLEIEEEKVEEEKAYEEVKVEEKKKEEVKKSTTSSISKSNNTNSEKNTSRIAILTGYMTGYAADCKMCGGTLGCLSSYNVYKNGVVTYPDKTYGNVRIVASSKNLACGSIIRFSSSRVSSSPTTAIVLDRGVGGNNIDLLVESESIASSQIGRSKVTYEVLRRGW